MPQHGSAVSSPALALASITSTELIIKHKPASCSKRELDDVSSRTIRSQLNRMKQTKTSWHLSGDAINTNTCIFPRRDSADEACHMCFVVLVTVKLTSQKEMYHKAMVPVSRLFVAEERTYIRRA